MKKISVLLLLLLSAPFLRAQYIPVPNGSFESPATDFASPSMDAWQKTAQPSWWDPNADGAWTNLMGEFLNTSNGQPDHIYNLDGVQAAFLFANPQVGIFQQVNATFAVGRSYTFTVGLTTSSEEPLSQGSTLLLAAYYLDGTNMDIVAATTATYDTNVFTNNAYLLDYQVNAPEVQAGDPWAGQPIGLELLSTVSFDLAGGVWDADNVRLTEGPALLNPAFASGQTSFTVSSYPGLAFNILATTNLALPATNWTSLGSLTNATGQTNFTDAAPAQPQRFYLLQQRP
jgi:hypothetical protein